QGAAPALQTVVSDLLALALVEKHAHWNVVGPLFRPLHELFDEMASAHWKDADRVAERLRALGCPVDGRPSAVSEATGVQEPPHGVLRDMDAAEGVLSTVEMTATRIREQLGQIEPEDLVSHDLLVGVLSSLDHFAWMLRSQS